MSKANDTDIASFTRRVAKLWSIFVQAKPARRQRILEVLQNLVEGKEIEGSEPEVYRVTMGITPTFQEWKGILGMLYWNPNITEANFPRDVVDGEVELRLHHFGTDISETEATRQLDAEGLVREDRLPVILAFLEANPDLQCQFPIITGATWVRSAGRRSVVYANGSSQSRSLTLLWDVKAWPDNFRFLVRRK